MGTRFMVPVGLAVALCAGTAAQAQQKPQRAFLVDGVFVTVDANGNLVPAATTQDQINDPFNLVARERMQLQLQERQRLGANGNTFNGNFNGNLNNNIPNGNFNTGRNVNFNGGLNGMGQQGFMQQRQALLAAQQGQAERMAVLQRQAGMQAAMARFRHQFAGANVNPLVQTMFTQGTINQFRGAAFPAQTLDRAMIEQQLAAQAMFNVSQAQGRAMFNGLSSGPEMVTNNIAAQGLNTGFNNGVNNGFNNFNSNLGNFNGNFNAGQNLNNFSGAGNGSFVTGFNNGFNNGFNGVVTPNSGFNTGFGFNTGVGFNGFNAPNSGFNTGLNSFNNGLSGFTTISGAGNFNGGFNNGFGGGFGGGFRTPRSFNSSQTAATGARASSFR